MQMFMSKEPPVKRTLADIIMEKITEKQTEIRTQMSGQDFLVSSFLKAPAALRQKYC